MATTRMVVLCSLLLSAGLTNGVQAGQPGSLFMCALWK